MLDLKNISKTFNPNTIHEKRALENLSLHLDKGDFATIVGSNGAGKSTLFNAISGSFLLDKGSVILEGRDITFLQEHKRSSFIGRLFQDPLMGTAPHMSIEENLSVSYIRASGLSLFSRAGKKEKAYFREQLSLADGDEFEKFKIPGTAEKVLSLTKRIVAEREITCLMITHNMHQALDLGNRTLMMDSGKIVLDLSGEEREHLTVDMLLRKFSEKAGKALYNDRILLS